MGGPSAATTDPKCSILVLRRSPKDAGACTGCAREGAHHSSPSIPPTALALTARRSDTHSRISHGRTPSLGMVRRTQCFAPSSLLSPLRLASRTHALPQGTWAEVSKAAAPVVTMASASRVMPSFLRAFASQVRLVSGLPSTFAPLPLPTADPEPASPLTEGSVRSIVACTLGRLSLVTSPAGTPSPTTSTPWRAWSATRAWTVSGPRGRAEGDREAAISMAGCTHCTAAHTSSSV
mmetsp:Transcript_25048/g.63219  ORF Transcript_25048/g.63219 Transcript_25048/m.63219 type:complete len:236 (-) Transcript_25048:500-1207(-)